MIRDKETIMVTATGLDLTTLRPGPGQPIKMFGVGLTASTDLIINTGADAAEAEAGLTHCITVTSDADGMVEFELPSDTQRFIAGVITTGSLQVSLAGNQTAK